MDPKELIGEVTRMARRRLALAAPIAVIGLALTLAFALTRPPSYEASAKILVEGPRIPDALARSTVNLSAAARLQLIEEQLMARDNLQQVLTRWELFDLPGITEAQRRDLLRQSTRIESISTATGQSNPWGGGGESGLFAFTITVTLEDGEKAAAIANEFAAEAVARNRLVRSDQAEDTLAYFQAEDDRLAATLAAKEAEIAAFKKLHADALPESLEARRGTLGRLRENLLEVDRRVMELEEKLADLGAAAAGERPLDAQGVAVDPGEARLRELELSLTAKLGTLGPNHPEIRALREQIAAVKTLVKPGLAPRGQAASGGPAGERRAAIERQSAQVSSQIERLNAQRADMATQAEALETAIAATPQVGIELDALTRGLAEIQAMSTDVTRRHAEARTGAELEASQRSERFEIVEAALVPDFPVASNRKKIAVLGAGASLALAGGLALLLELLNPAPRTAAAMERQLGIRPVVSIPYVYRPGERARRRLRWAVVALALGLGIGFGLPAVDRAILPLRPVAARIANAAGLGALVPPEAPAAEPPL